MKYKHALHRRFILSIAVYGAVILALWFAYHTITHGAISQRERENAILAADSLTRQIGADLRQMNTVASVIAESDFVRDFLAARDTAAYYDKAVTVSQLVRRTAFPISSADSVITISAEGRIFRFSGGISNSSLETLSETLGGYDILYTIIELDETMYFCHIVHVIDYSGRLPVSLGKVVMLTGLDRTRRMLNYGNDADGLVIQDGVVLLSNNPAIEGKTAQELEPEYGVVSIAPIDGTALSVAAAIPNDVLFPESALFFAIAFVTLSLLLVMIVMLYRYQSRNIVAPAVAELQRAFDVEIARKNMQISLLASQMDTHFVVNTLENVTRLAEMGDTSKTARMSEGLAAILQHQHAGDALINIFDDLTAIRQYIDVMNIRFGEKFTTEYDVEDTLEACLTMGLILQPIVENALTHGLQGMERDARLVIKGYMREGDVVMEVIDNGKGIPPEKLKAIQESLAQPNLADFPEPGLRGVALVNIQRRIRIRYGDGYGLTIDSERGKGTTVTVKLPAIADV